MHVYDRFRTGDRRLDVIPKQEASEMQLILRLIAPF